MHSTDSGEPQIRFADCTAEIAKEGGGWAQVPMWVSSARLGLSSPGAPMLRRRRTDQVELTGLIPL
jgi:hypothetical protein